MSPPTLPWTSSDRTADYHRRPADARGLDYPCTGGSLLMLVLNSLQYSCHTNAHTRISSCYINWRLRPKALEQRSTVEYSRVRGASALLLQATWFTFWNAPARLYGRS